MANGNGNDPNQGAPSAGMIPGAGINPQALLSSLTALAQLKAQGQMPQLSGLRTPAAIQGQLPAGGPPPAQSPLLGGLFPSTPADPNATSDAMQRELLRATQTGEQLTGESIQRGRGLGDVATQAIAQQAAIPIPPMGHPWHIGTWTDPKTGMVHHPNFLQNIGNVLGMIASATGPGRAIEAAYYGPRIREYEAETGMKAQQIKELQTQQEREQQTVASTAGMIYHPLMAGARIESADAAMLRAKTAAAGLQHRIENDAELRKIDWKRLDYVATGQQLHKLLTEEGFAMTMRGQDLTFTSREDAIAAVSAMQGSKMWNEMDQSIKAKLLAQTGASNFVLPSAAVPGATVPASPGFGGAAPGTSGTPATPEERLRNLDRIKNRGKGRKSGNRVVDLTQ